MRTKTLIEFSHGPRGPARPLRIVFTETENCEREVIAMSTNDQFLKEFMRTVDMRVFTPSLYRFFTEFLSIERVRRYGKQYVISTFIPPFPGRAFDRFLDMFIGNGEYPQVNSVDFAVTNACMFNCRHCYNAGRKVDDPSIEDMQDVVSQLQRQGVFVINFTGGEPCLRADLPRICEALNDGTSAIVSTTGYGFTDDMARSLHERGVYAISISLDSADEVKHDRIRGVKGAYQIALKGIETALKHDFYTYTCVVPSGETLENDSFQNLVELNRRLGVHEIQILEPAPAGKLLHSSSLLEPNDFETIFQYMAEYNSRENGPAISSFAHLESPEFFGCGAGFSHIYIDGTGEVSPCNMMPVTYGNAYSENLSGIIERMQTALRRPCRACRAYVQRDFFQEHAGRGCMLAGDKALSVPAYDDGLPRFYELLEVSEEETSGANEIMAGYSVASETYDDYWLTVASGPIDDLFQYMNVPTGATAIDCGCGTGYTTSKLARRVGSKGRVIGIDLTSGMIERAKERFTRLGLNGTRFHVGDVLLELGGMESNSVDLATLTWLIGYVACDEIFPELSRVIKPGGQIGLVAHLDHSPELPFDIFEELVRENPNVLEKAVRMKFPRDDNDVSESLIKSGFEIKLLQSGTFTVTCHDGREVFDHVMKSGAGSTFYHSIRVSDRQRLIDDFICKIDRHYASAGEIPIIHRYVVGIAVR
jgi:MoaA/NifB/PqqE/SkfB family radical SAM enzyme/ubiquinone/menaquinone biosynthesis C-methylase UbiE